jgi:hypothetical protein
MHATGITANLKSGDMLEKAASMANLATIPPDTTTAADEVLLRKVEHVEI